jgi:hypothetical protein
MRKTKVSQSESSVSDHPASENAKRDRATKALDELKRLRKGVTLGGLSWKALRDEGRK